MIDIKGDRREMPGANTTKRPDRWQLIADAVVRRLFHKHGE